MINTETLSSDPAGITQAAMIIRAGGTVAFPTETVYGLGGDACSDQAVAKIFAAKDRPSFNPLIIHVSDINMADRFAELNDVTRDLARAFWPGALTLVLPIRDGAGLSDLTTAGLSTVGVRVPDSQIARDLIARSRTAIAAPSANPSGKISPTSATHVLEGLSGRIDAVIDGGACTVGVESTIIGFDPVPTLLRPGGVPVKTIEACLGFTLAAPEATDTPTAPGQLSSHYAPDAAVRLNVDRPKPGEILLGFGMVDEAAENLSPSGDLVEAAANLFAMLRKLNETGAPIAVSPIPNIGLGLAINDRLQRAAAPRPQA